MKRVIIIILLFAFWVACKKNPESESETVLTGRAKVYVDQTLQPIIEEQIQVFESQYRAKIELISKSEAEIINDLIRGKAQIGILARELTAAEVKAFDNKKIFPKVTEFGSDGIAFIRNSSVQDTVLKVNDVLLFLQGQKIEGISSIVFDDLNSSTARQLAELAKINSFPEKAYSLSSSKETIKYVANNKGALGIVGLSWLNPLDSGVQEELQKIKLLSVMANGGMAVAPTQDALAAGSYPLARRLFIVNAQGFAGLGMGFSSFIAGERGQRIILKSGLLPVRLPGRKINVVN